MSRHEVKKEAMRAARDHVLAAGVDTCVCDRGGDPALLFDPGFRTWHDLKD